MIEPHVSVPIANAARPAATIAPEPEDEPQVQHVVSQDSWPHPARMRRRSGSPFRQPVRSWMFANHHRPTLSDGRSRGVVIEYLVCIGLRAPGGEALSRADLFRGRRNPVQRTTVMPADLFFRPPWLVQGNLGRQAGVGVESRSERLAAGRRYACVSSTAIVFSIRCVSRVRLQREENLFARHSGCSSGILRAAVYRNWFRGLGGPFLSRSIKGLRYSPGPSPLSVQTPRQPIERWLCFGASRRMSDF